MTAMNDNSSPFICAKHSIQLLSGKCNWVVQNNLISHEGNEIQFSGTTSAARKINDFRHVTLLEILLRILFFITI